MAMVNNADIKIAIKTINGKIKMTILIPQRDR